jgi:hypothetical protein
VNEAGEALCTFPTDATHAEIAERLQAAGYVLHGADTVTKIGAYLTCEACAVDYPDGAAGSMCDDEGCHLCPSSAREHREFLAMHEEAAPGFTAPGVSKVLGSERCASAGPAPRASAAAAAMPSLTRHPTA